MGRRISNQRFVLAHSKPVTSACPVLSGLGLYDVFAICSPYLAILLSSEESCALVSSGRTIYKLGYCLSYPALYLPDNAFFASDSEDGFDSSGDEWVLDRAVRTRAEHEAQAEAGNLNLNFELLNAMCSQFQAHRRRR